MLGPATGQPSSRTCFEAFRARWVSAFGWPETVTCDRGLHNRGYFAKALAAGGVHLRNVGLESPHQLGRAERHGGTLKLMIEKVVTASGATGPSAIADAVETCCATKNAMLTVGGFSPDQWVLGRQLRAPGSLTNEDEAGKLGLHSELFNNPSSEFAMREEMRWQAQRAFVKADCSRRLRATLLRQAVPQRGP